MDLDFLTEAAIDLGLAGDSRDAVLRALVDRLAIACPDVGVDRDALARALQDREALGSTGIGQGVAVPHCKYRGVARVIGVLGRTAEGVEFNARDGKPARLFFLIVSPIDASGPHIRVLAAISRLMRDDTVRGKLLAAGAPAEALRCLRSAGA